MLQGVLDITLSDQVCQRLATGCLFSPDSPISSINKTEYIAEILLKMALNTIDQTNYQIKSLKL